MIYARKGFWRSYGPTSAQGNTNLDLAAQCLAQASFECSKCGKLHNLWENSVSVSSPSQQIFLFFRSNWSFPCCNFYPLLLIREEPGSTFIASVQQKQYLLLRLSSPSSPQPPPGHRVLQAVTTVVALTSYWEQGAQG